MPGKQFCGRFLVSLSFPGVLLLILSGCRLFSPSGTSGIPVVQITNPQHGDTVSTAYETIRVTVSSREEIKKVRFYDNNLFLGEAYAEPFEHLWETAYVSIGQHQLYAEAIDASGNTGRSSDIVVYVSKGDLFDWALVNTPTSNDLRALFALDEQSIWACGNNGTIIVFDGTGWQLDNTPPSSDNDLFDLYLITREKGWCVGDNIMLSYEDGSWSVLFTYTKKQLSSLYIFDDTTGWVGDGEGILYTFDGDTLVEYDTIDSVMVTDILGFSSSDAWASCGGSLYHFDGASWFRDTVFSGEQINALFSHDGSSIWAVGTGLFFYDGFTWEIRMLPNTTSEAHGIYAPAQDSGMVCGEQQGSGFAFFFDDTLWTEMSLQRDVPIYDLEGFAGGDGWVVGAGGTILRRTSQ